MFLARRQYLKHGVHHNYILFVIIYISMDCLCLTQINNNNNILKLLQNKHNIYIYNNSS